MIRTHESKEIYWKSTNQIIKAWWRDYKHNNFKTSYRNSKFKFSIHAEKSGSNYFLYLKA